MTTDALAAERARFWRSAWRYYRYINRARGRRNATTNWLGSVPKRTC
jgi:hypothetical protein